MFNNPALDVAVGLIFIYALYSLLATTLTELIAALFNQRGVVLRRGIKRMLDNEDPPERKDTANVDATQKVDEKTKTEGGDQGGVAHMDENLSPLFLNKTAIKYLGRKSLLGKYKDPSYIRPQTFSKTLLETLGYVYAKKEDLTELISRLNPKNETHKYILNLIEQADENVDRFRQLAEDWYDETMDRVSGWYKRRIQRITFCIGLIVALGLNINTIEMAKKLSVDDEARVAMVQAATSYLSQVDTATTVKSANVDHLKTQVEGILKESSNVQSILVSAYPDLSETNKGKEWWLGLLSYVFGCFITAVALSLGAPFWFDLLNKLVKLRSSGTQEKARSKNSSSNTPVG